MTWNGIERRSCPLPQEECYTRHADIEGHIKEGKWWRGVIITACVTFGAVLIGQFNMAIQNNNRIIEANARLAQIVEINSKRLTALEDLFPRIVRGPQGPQGIQGIPGQDGR